MKQVWSLTDSSITFTQDTIKQRGQHEKRKPANHPVQEKVKLWHYDFLHGEEEHINYVRNKSGLANR